MLQPGDQLGRYTIRRLLGKGGWGEVYEAHDPELGRPVAIKRMPHELALDRDIRARFEREARTVAALDHPNIVTIHSVEEDGGQRFITMQLVRGRTLDQLIPKSGMPLAEIFRIAIPLADAVAAAHERGVVHRDLKPANVMVTTDGQVKVLDFGLAKLTPQDETETLAGDAKTATGSVLGTLTYMSPEQLRGSPADARSDIFSLGIVLYEMATGRAPFGGRSSVEVAASILRDRPSAVSEIKAGLPRHLDRIIHLCLEEDPGRRFQSARDVRNQLEHLREELASGRPPQTPQPLPVPPAERAPRKRRAVALATVALAGLLAAVLLLTRDARETAPPAGSAEPAAVADGTTRIVVLPFADRGPPAVDYFGAALTEEISSRLAEVDGLGVISRISANQYAETDKSARQIGDELGVAYILAGSVTWRADPDGADQVQVAPTLIRVDDDIEIWGDSYERSVDDIFDIQSEIAAGVSRQLGERLGTGAVAGGERRPTASLAAYQAYLRGLHYARRPVYTLENCDQAVAGFREAVELDPGFAAAWAWLARAHAFTYHLRLDRSAERRRLARDSLERALELDAEGAEARLAAGYYYYEVEQDYPRALAEFAAVERRLPNHYEVHEARGYVLRRQGLWEQAQASLERAFELNPRDAALAGEIAESYANNREYDSALRWLDQSIALDPDQVFAYVSKAWVLLLRGGDLTAARATLARMRPSDDTLAAWAWFWLELFDGDPRRALERLPHDQGEWIQSREWPQAVMLLRAQALELAGEDEAARAAYRAAAELLRTEVEKVPTDAHHQIALGLAYAGLGRDEAAIRHGERATELQPVSKDAFSGTSYLGDLALIYARTGRTGQALKVLDQLLTQPALMSPAWLRVDPRWQVLSGERLFEEMRRRRGDAR